MTIQFQFRGLNGDEPARRRMTGDLEALHSLIPLLSAQVALEHQPDATPPYQVIAAVAADGPGFRAAARDHDWLPAWEKVIRRLRQQIEAHAPPKADRGGASCGGKPQPAARAGRRT
ncbi:MAG TPA: hypothetical protein PKX23_04055 [Verrucomicrobiota bacterium]|jgi:hypothetical protein|nr:hypothetical protein [Verrucomicrobiota bacterium]HRT07989.1 hypothetical protein [Candidatus Paceibacterota bacterium]HRT56502.1 hypothetical protein [Candidatus Paceibacterota bacterium]